MRKRLCIGACLACLLSMGHVGAAVAAGPSAAGVHMFAGIQGNSNATQADAVAAARMSDIVYGLAVQIRKFGPAMRQANPHVRLYVYVNGEAAQAKDCATFPASWYLYGKSGTKVRSRTNLNCAMYPLSTQIWHGYAGWVDYVRHLCATNIATAPLAEGCFVDQISSALNSGFATTLPVDPATRQLYRASTWMAQMGSIGQRIQAFTGKPVIGNSYEGGGRYWGVPTNLVNGYGVAGFESEHFLNAQSVQWTQLPHWTENINMMIDAQSRGKSVNVGFTDAPSTNEETWRQFVVASYLLGNNGHAWLAFAASNKHTYTDPSPLYRMPVGTPLTTAGTVHGYEIKSGVFVRRYTAGVVLVNLSGATASVPLGGTYHDVSGRSFTTLSLPNARGAVLVK